MGDGNCCFFYDLNFSLIFAVIYVGDLDDDQALEAFEEDDSENDAENGASDSRAHLDEEDNAVEIPERDDSQLTFTKHNAPIFCAALHPNEGLAGKITSFK